MKDRLGLFQWQRAFQQPALKCHAERSEASRIALKRNETGASLRSA